MFSVVGNPFDNYSLIDRIRRKPWTKNKKIRQGAISSKPEKDKEKTLGKDKKIWQGAISNTYGYLNYIYIYMLLCFGKKKEGAGSKK